MNSGLGQFDRENPSPRYVELVEQYRHLHAHGSPELGIAPEAMFPGQSLVEHVGELLELFREFHFSSVLDYGCGKARLYRPGNQIQLGDRVYDSLQDLFGVPVTLYDPAYLPYAIRPQTRADLVVCTDVLEHCAEEDLPWILGDLFNFAARFVFANVACYPAHKSLPNGENAHCTVADVAWWRAQIEAAARANPGRQYRFICTLDDGSRTVIAA